MRKSVITLMILAFLLGVIAPACGFLWGGKYSVIEICTAQGIEQRLIADADTSDSDKDHNPTSSKQCEFCFQNAHFATHLTAVPVFEKIAFTSAKIRFDLYEDILLSRTRSTASARGPPLFV